MKNFLDLNNIHDKELREIIETAKSMKARRVDLLKGEADPENVLNGYIVGLIFEKPSTRTRISFDVGVRQMGGQTIILSSAEMQLSKGESVSDTGRVLSKYLDMIMVRTFKEETLLELARYSSVPVINGLTNNSHPCQVMADILTFEEEKGDVAGKKVVWVGDGNNVCLSYIHAAVKFQFELVVSSPSGCLPGEKHIAAAVEAGGKVAVCDSPREAVNGADLVVTDTFFSMHENSANRADKLKKFSDYQVSQSLLNNAKADVAFLHCLPAHRGLEVTADVIDGNKSLVFKAAENRLHVQKSIMKWCLGI